MVDYVFSQQTEFGIGDVMGILNNAFGFIQKTTQTIIKSASSKIEEAERKRKEEEQRFILEFPYKYRYTVRQTPTVYLDLGLWQLFERKCYEVYNSNNELVFRARGSILFGNHHFVILDSDKNKVGKVNRALFNIQIPFMKKRRTCKINLINDDPFVIESHIPYGAFDLSLGREYNISKRDISVVENVKNKEYKVYGREESEPIFHIYKVRSDSFLYHQYLLGFNDEKNELPAVSVAIGIDTLHFS